MLCRWGCFITYLTTLTQLLTTCTINTQNASCKCHFYYQVWMGCKHLLINIICSTALSHHLIQIMTPTGCHLTPNRRIPINSIQNVSSQFYMNVLVANTLTLEINYMTKTPNISSVVLYPHPHHRIVMVTQAAISLPRTFEFNDT